MHSAMGLISKAMHGAWVNLQWGFAGLFNVGHQWGWWHWVVSPLC